MTDTPRILMCPPDYYEVGYAINPWMDGNAGRMDRERARAQWEILRWSISQVAEVVTMDPEPGLPDMVFTANAGVVYGNRAIASHFMPMERRPGNPAQVAGFFIVGKPAVRCGAAHPPRAGYSSVTSSLVNSTRSSTPSSLSSPSANESTISGSG